MVRSIETILLHALFDNVSAHGHMINPRSRNMNRHDKTHWDDKEYTPQGLFDRTSKCGNATYDKPAKGWPVLESGTSDKYSRGRKWTNQLTGAEFEVEVYITAQHGGPHYLQYACMDDQMDVHPQDATGYEYLERADSDRDDVSFRASHPKALWIGYLAGLGNNPELYTPGRVVPITDANKAIYKSKWKTPKGKCNRGVIVWQWDNPLSCVPRIRAGDQMTPDEFKEAVEPGMSQAYLIDMKCPLKVNTINSNWKINPAGESFLNCADVMVNNGSGGASDVQVPTTPKEVDMVDEIRPTDAREVKSSKKKNRGKKCKCNHLRGKGRRNCRRACKKANNEEPEPAEEVTPEPEPAPETAPVEPAPETAPVKPAEDAGECDINHHGEYYADPSDSRKFFRCLDGELSPRTCQGVLVYDQSIGLCNWP